MGVANSRSIISELKTRGCKIEYLVDDLGGAEKRITMPSRPLTVSERRRIFGLIVYAFTSGGDDADRHRSKRSLPP